MHNIPAHIINTHIANAMNSRQNALKLRMLSKLLNPKRVSQRNVAKSMLPRNAGRKPVNTRISRVTGRIPAHLRSNNRGRYVGGHKSIQNIMDMYFNGSPKKRRLNSIVSSMEKNQAELPKRVKNMFNRKLLSKK